MGRRTVREIAVPKSVTVGLLAVLTLLMLGLVYWLSGRAFAGDSSGPREFLARLLGYRREGVSRSALLASLMPVLANVLLFVPWGFLFFAAVDSGARRRRRTYLLTLGAALLFAVATYVWQLVSLPTRVTSLYDAVANGAGAVAGGALAHARKLVRVRFEI